ncbi:metal-dependent transcriptional regulator [Deinococcus pimensis]|uniref:metal-dependent transcriptional regulator n=1 Tax=Deinococcus pimensis TaxID=309888 RepID=UPI0004858C48|nr:metal-dependent transcriptional regulator [Deinococcus pimensis]
MAPPISHAMEDYLKQLYLLGQHGRVSTQALADSLGVSAPSTTNMLRRLAELGLVTHQPYQGAALSPEGERVALEILRHHRLLELYLHRALGYPLDEVHDEAERLEHVISEAFEDRIAEWLGHPDFDPHGDPIPAKNGDLPARDTRPLTTLRPGALARIERVPGETTVLRALMERGLTPGALVRLVRREEELGTVTVHVAEQDRTLGMTVAERVLVTEEVPA